MFISILVIVRRDGLGPGEKMTIHLSNGLMTLQKSYCNRRKIVLPIGMVAVLKMENIACRVYTIEGEIIVHQEDFLIRMSQV